MNSSLCYLSYWTLGGPLVYRKHTDLLLHKLLYTTDSESSEQFKTLFCNNRRIWEKVEEAEMFNINVLTNPQFSVKFQPNGPLMTLNPPCFSLRGKFWQNCRDQINLKNPFGKAQRKQHFTESDFPRWSSSKAFNPPPSIFPEGILNPDPTHT